LWYVWESGERCIQNLLGKPEGYRHLEDIGVNETVKVKVKFILEQATKAQRGRRGIPLLFL
jgi:hypothetical protein